MTHWGKRHIYRDKPILPLTTFCGLVKERVDGNHPKPRTVFMGAVTVEEASDPRMTGRFDGPWCKRCRAGAGLEAK